MLTSSNDSLTTAQSGWRHVSAIFEKADKLLFAIHREMCKFFKNTFFNQFRWGFNCWDTTFKSLIFWMERYKEVQYFRGSSFMYIFMSTEIKTILNSTRLQIPPFPQRWNYSLLPTSALLSASLRQLLWCFFFFSFYNLKILQLAFPNQMPVMSSWLYFIS